MGYELRAILGREPAIRAAAAGLRKAVVVPLGEDLQMIPLTEDLFDEIGARYPGDEGRGAEGFFYLSISIAQWLVQASAEGTVAYIEADFAGGVGMQSSVVWKGGERIQGPNRMEDRVPARSEWPINRALRVLGVARRKGDEFETVGLGRHRHVEDWIE